MWLLISFYIHCEVEEAWLLIHEIAAALCGANDAGESRSVVNGI